LNAFYRFVLTLLCFVATFYFVFWTGGALLLSFLPLAAWQAASFMLAAAASIAVAVFIWKRSKDSHGGLVASIFKGAFILGAIGFIAGFFGPIVFAPDSNQGPLLGIFFTGPLAFLLGGVGGAIYWMARGRHANEPEQQA
jgi:hypothetical protein